MITCIIIITLVSFSGEIPCECSEHTGRTLLNEIYNGEVETIFQLIFTDSDFYRSFLKSRNTTSKERMVLTFLPSRKAGACNTLILLS